MKLSSRAIITRFLLKEIKKLKNELNELQTSETVLDPYFPKDIYSIIINNKKDLDMMFITNLLINSKTDLVHLHKALLNKDSEDSKDFKIRKKIFIEPDYKFLYPVTMPFINKYMNEIFNSRYLSLIDIPERDLNTITSKKVIEIKTERNNPFYLYNPNIIPKIFLQPFLKNIHKLHNLHTLEIDIWCFYPTNPPPNLKRIETTFRRFLQMRPYFLKNVTVLKLKDRPSLYDFLDIKKNFYPNITTLILPQNYNSHYIKIIKKYFTNLQKILYF